MEKKFTYNLFKPIHEVNSKSDVLEFNTLLTDFINAFRLKYKLVNSNIIEDFPQEPSENTIKFMINLGVINSRDEIKVLEKKIGISCRRLIHYLNQCELTTDVLDDFLKKFIKSEREKKAIESNSSIYKPTILDLFSGAGGLSLGFSQEGFKILLSNDIEKACTQTYWFNHPEMPKEKVLNGDIKEIIEHIEDYVTEEVDLILGGPPCQGFSMANRQRVIDDPRNILYKYYVLAVKKLKPKVFIMENVKGMLSVADQVQQDFLNLNGVSYDVSYHIFNANNFGIPQNRERLIYVGIRNDIKERNNLNANDIIHQILDESAKIDNVYLKEAIEDLKTLEALRIKNATEFDSDTSGSKIDYSELRDYSRYVETINDNRSINYILNHKARYNNDRDIEIFGRMHPGDKSDSERIADIMPYTSRKNIFKDKYYKLKPDAFCKTITAHMKFDCNMYIHPYQARGLTPREAARVQSYPDDYFFLGSYTKTYMQIGNSVPPLMSRYIAKIIKKLM